VVRPLVACLHAGMGGSSPARRAATGEYSRMRLLASLGCRRRALPSAVLAMWHQMTVPLEPAPPTSGGQFAEVARTSRVLACQLVLLAARRVDTWESGVGWVAGRD